MLTTALSSMNSFIERVDATPLATAQHNTLSTNQLQLRTSYRLRLHWLPNLPVEPNLPFTPSVIMVLPGAATASKTIGPTNLLAPDSSVTSVAASTRVLSRSALPKNNEVESSLNVSSRDCLSQMML